MTDAIECPDLGADWGIEGNYNQPIRFSEVTEL
jgi:hypothetical protein